MGSFTELIKNKRFAPGRGVTEPPPEKGIRRFGFLLWNHFWKLITLNLLFIAFCIPVVTIPAAFCGMNRPLIKLVRDGNCFLWSEFIKEFKANLLKSLPFGILGAFFLLDAYYFLSLSISAPDGFEIFTGALGFMFILFAVLFSSYVFVFLPTLSLNNRSIAKNALILLITEWKTSLTIIGCMLLNVFVTIAFFPYTIFFLLFISFSLYQLAVCTAINEPLQRCIIGPYEENMRQTP